MRKIVLCLAVLLLSSCGDDLGWDQKVNTKDADCYDATEPVDSGVCNLCQDVTEVDVESDTSAIPEDVTVTDSNRGGSDSGNSDADDVSVDSDVPDSQGDVTETGDAGSDAEEVVNPPECVTATDCAAVSLPCVAPDCQAGKCVIVTANTPCSDDNECTAGDMCQLDKCVPGIALNCDDLNPCTDDSCDPTKGCVSLANSATCTDGNSCTLDDVCSSSQCVGKPAICDDGELCTDDSCDPATGCVNLANSATCTDGNECTLDDKCAEGKCKSGELKVCPQPVCTVSSCELGLCVTNLTLLNDTDCDDGNPCTTLSKCLDASCLAVINKTCDDGNSCTTESCDSKDGSCATSNVADDTPCGKDSICVSGVCKLVQTCGDVDSDGDGVNDKCDCEPLNKLVSPNLLETCDGADNNCNGTVDENSVCGTTGTVKVSVISSSSKAGLKDSVVNIKPAGKCSAAADLAPAVLSSTSDVSGKSLLKPDPGSYCIEVTLLDYKKAITSDFEIEAGEVRSLIVPLVPTSVPDNLISVCGVVEDSVSKLPIQGASVSVAVNSADNVVGTAKTDVTGLYCVTSLKSVNVAIVTALAEGYVSDTKNVTPPPNGVGIVQDFKLQVSLAGACYSNDFEDGIEGWTIDPPSAGNQWQVIDNAAPIKNSVYPVCVNVWPSEKCVPNPNDISDSCQICGNPLQLACTPEAGSLPRSYKGTHAFWYGAASTGNFNGTTGAQCNPGSGGNGPANGGTATTPEQTLKVDTSNHVLSFAYWYEIEGVAPQYPTFDSMNVYLSINGGPFSPIGHLNPSTSFGYQGPDAYTSGGGGQAPAWGVRHMTMTNAKAGDKVKVKFEFKTGDGAYNGFRGWVIDDVKILGVGCK